MRGGSEWLRFAVVAREVRKLAERRQTAASEISALSSGTLKIAQTACEILTRLVPDIKKIADLVQEISAACREQDVGASQIHMAIQQLDKVTQQNAAASEQLASTSEELSSQAEQPQRTISYSNGAEPYSLAMVCQNFASNVSEYRFEVLTTDISSDVLRTAVRAVYPHSMVKTVPMELRKR